MDDQMDDQTDQPTDYLPPQVRFSIAPAALPLSFFGKLNLFFAELTSLPSLLSMSVLIMSAVFVGVGYFLTDRLHSQGVPFLFFLSPMVIMIGYAIGYGSYTSSKPQFDGGLISARFVLRSIYSMSSAAFAWAGVQMMMDSWTHPAKGFNIPDPIISVLCLWMVPALMVAFAVVYGLYTCNCETDMSARNRSGNARRSMVFMTLLTLGIFTCNVVESTRTLDVTSIFISLASFAGAFAVTFVVMFAFNNAVSLRIDQGIQAS